VQIHNTSRFFNVFKINILNLTSLHFKRTV
jgi:hypothetical protein